MRVSTLNSYNFQIHDLEKVRVAEVVLASDPFYTSHDPSLSAAFGVMVDHQNWHLWDGVFWEESPGWWESEQLWGQQM